MKRILILLFALIIALSSTSVIAQSGAADSAALQVGTLYD